MLTHTSFLETYCCNVSSITVKSSGLTILPVSTEMESAVSSAVNGGSSVSSAVINTASSSTVPIHTSAHHSAWSAISFSGKNLEHVGHSTSCWWVLSAGWPTDSSPLLTKNSSSLLSTPLVLELEDCSLGKKVGTTNSFTNVLDSSLKKSSLPVHFSCCSEYRGSLTSD